MTFGAGRVAFGQVWHLPPVRPALTGRQFVKLAAKPMNGSDQVRVMPKWLLKVPGWFSPFIGEAYEMTYQDEFAFQFDSSTHHIHFFVIEKAKDSLLSTDKSVAEIAYTLGFDYPQYFNKLFKQRTGKTPLAFRSLN